MIFGIHGLESHAGWFSPLQRELADRGEELVTFTRRARRDVRDSSEWIDEIALRCSPGADVLAHSWGAKLALRALQLGRIQIRSLVLLTPGMFLQRDLRDPARWRLDLPAVPIPIADSRFSRDPDVLRFLASDPDRLREVTPEFLREDARLTRSLAESRSAIELPTLVLLADEDAMIDEAETRAYLARVAHAATVETIAERGHLLLLEAPELLAMRLVRWTVECSRVGTG